MSGSKGNYIALVEDPNEQFGKTMRFPDELLETYYRLVMERELAARRPDGGEARARALHRRAWHGEEAARAAEEHFTRVVREGEAPDEVAEAPAPGRRSGPSARAARRHLRRELDQRGAAADRPGSASRSTASRPRSSTSPGPASQEPSSRRETAVHAVFRRLTGASELLPCPGCPIGRCRTVPVPRHWSAHRTQPDTTKVFRSFPGPLARVGGFFTPDSSDGL